MSRKSLSLGILSGPHREDLPVTAKILLCPHVVLLLHAQTTHNIVFYSFFIYDVQHDYIHIHLIAKILMNGSS
jgi:hypothetical protein